MLSRRSWLGLAFSIWLSWGCGSTKSSPPRDPGPLVDNTLWVPSEEGDAIFGPRRPDARCEVMPIDCAEYPWPEGQCVDFGADSTCIAAYVPECFPPSHTVLAVYTRMPDERIPLCNWLTLQQPSLRRIVPGDQIEIRVRHSTLTAPQMGEARLGFAVGDELAFDARIPIDPFLGAQFLTRTWTASRDYPKGTRLLWHVDNHGRNEYMLIEVNVL